MTDEYLVAGIGFSKNEKVELWTFNDHLQNKKKRPFHANGKISVHQSKDFWAAFKMWRKS